MGSGSKEEGQEMHSPLEPLGSIPADPFRLLEQCIFSVLSH